jgi:hypothetical protein
VHQCNTARIGVASLPGHAASLRGLRSRPVGARVLLAVSALLVLGWTGVLLRDYVVGHDAATRSFFATGLSRADRDRDRERLADATLLDPSSYWSLAHASNLLAAGDRRGAAREAESLVRDEPESTTAWALLRAATSQGDPARAAEAAARLRELNPLGSR